MIIHQDNKRLMQAGQFKVIEHDQWSITVEVLALREDNGDPCIWHVGLSTGELVAIARYCANNKLSDRLKPLPRGPLEHV